MVMADTTHREPETTLDSMSDLIVLELKQLIDKYDFSSDFPCFKMKVINIDDLEDKPKHLEYLRSDLLPSLDHQIQALLSSLDLPDSYWKLATPNPDLSLDILFHLDATLENIVSVMINLAFGPPLADETYDHHLKQLKIYRCSRLSTKIESIIKLQIYPLFKECISLIQCCQPGEPSTNTSRADPQPETAIDQSAYRQVRNKIMKIAADCHRLIDQTIDCSRKSDLAVVQENWLVDIESLDTTLNTLTSLINKPTIEPTPAPPADLTPSADDQTQRNLLSNRDVILHIAKSTITLVKLTRLFLNQILERHTTKKLGFTFQREITSQQLEALRWGPNTVAWNFDKLAFQLSNMYRRNRAISDRDLIRNLVYLLPRALESTLTNLSFYLIPLPHHRIDDLSSSTDQANHGFEGRFLAWKALWDQTRARLLDFIHEHEVLHDHVRQENGTFVLVRPDDNQAV